MNDHFSSPVTTDDVSVATQLRWLSRILFLGGLCLLLVKYFRPELLQHLGGDHPQLEFFSVVAMFVASVLYIMSKVMTQRVAKLKRKTLPSNQFQPNYQSSQPLVAESTVSAAQFDTLPDGDLPEESEADEESYSSEEFESEAELLALNDSWPSGTIVSDQGSLVKGLWAFAILWNLVSVPSIIPVTLGIRDGEWGLVFVYFFPLIGFLLLWAAIRTTIQHRRFGKSTFTLYDRMGRIGGSLKGTIRSSVDVRPLEYYNIKLLCREKITTGSGKNRSTEVKTRWESAQKLPANGHSVLSGIPIVFNIPKGVPESFDENTSGAVKWTLQISASLKGVDYEAEFEVPVFRSRKSSGEQLGE